jgi:hypothetical protein
MADLITLAELRTALGTDPTDTRDDARNTAMIGYASGLIRNYTGRDFGAPSVTETRTYNYDGSGTVDIDDASAITAVVMTWPGTGAADVTIPTTDWRALPDLDDDTAVYQYISMPGYTGGIGYGSPEMGFTWNLDVYASERGYQMRPPYVKVTGTFGWPVVPGDVKMATIWTLQEWISRPSGEGLSSEAIEGWSRTWGGRSGAAALAIPGRARDILANYAQVLV